MSPTLIQGMSPSPSPRHSLNLQAIKSSPSNQKTPGPLRINPRMIKPMPMRIGPATPQKSSAKLSPDEQPFLMMPNSARCNPAAAQTQIRNPTRANEFSNGYKDVNQWESKNFSTPVTAMKNQQFTTAMTVPNIPMTPVGGNFSDQPYQLVNSQTTLDPQTPNNHHHLMQLLHQN